MAYLQHESTGQAAVQHNAFNRVPDTSGASFASFGARRASLEAHDVIYYEGDSAKRIYELASGTVMMFKLLPDGRRQVVEVLRPGDIFGLSNADEYDCTAETLTSSEVHEIDLKLVEASVDLQRKLTRCLTHQMHVLHEHAVLLGRKSAIERVASFLMYLVPNRGGVGCIGPADEENDGCDIHLHMTRQEIADYLGLTIETVSRQFSELRDLGLIETEGRSSCSASTAVR